MVAARYGRGTRRRLTEIAGSLLLPSRVPRRATEALRPTVSSMTPGPSTKWRRAVLQAIRTAGQAHSGIELTGRPAPGDRGSVNQQDRASFPAHMTGEAGADRWCRGDLNPAGGLRVLLAGCRPVLGEDVS